MDPILGFESDCPEAEGEEELRRGYDFSLVSQAIMLSREVAENVFARCAKKKLRTDLGKNVGIMLSRDGVLPIFTYHASESLTVEIPETPNTDFETRLTGELFRLATKLSKQIVEDRQDKDPGVAARPTKILLIDSLSCQVLEIAPRCYSFRLGQKWGIS